MQWKLEELLAQADAIEVANRIGIPITRNGATLYIPNVDGTRETRHNHTQLFHDGCYNYTTATGRNTYGMVRDYYTNVLGRSLSHDEICEYIADTCGGAEQYIVKHDKKKGPKPQPFPLTNEELELIGLLPQTHRRQVIDEYSSWPTEKCAERIFEGEDAVYVKTHTVPGESLFNLFREDPEAFYYLVDGKVKETAEEVRGNYRWAKNLKHQEMKTAFLRVLSEKYKQLQKVAEKLKKAHYITAKQKKVA